MIGQAGELGPPETDEFRVDVTASEPLVSVVVPAFNAGKTIGRTLCSVIAQSYPNVEIIVVDDGSTDDTAMIVEAFAHKHLHIRYVRQENSGVASARNHGLRLSQGRYFAPIDADDVWLPSNLSRQVAALEANAPTSSFSFAGSFIIDEADNRREKPALRSVRSDYVGLLRRNFVGNGSAAVFRREAVLALGGYDESLRVRAAQGAEDWKLVLQLASRTPGLFVADQLIGYRVVPGSMSMDPVSMTRSTMIVIEEMRRLGPKVAPWHFWHARTTIHISMFYRWIHVGRLDAALWCLLQAYVGNPLWFTDRVARDFLFKQLLPHLTKRLNARAAISDRNVNSAP